MYQLMLRGHWCPHVHQLNYYNFLTQPILLLAPKWVKVDVYCHSCHIKLFQQFWRQSPPLFHPPAFFSTFSNSIRCSICLSPAHSFPTATSITTSAHHLSITPYVICALLIQRSVNPKFSNNKIGRPNSTFVKLFLSILPLSSVHKLHLFCL